MAEIQKALLAMHNPNWEKMYIRQLTGYGYEVSIAKTVNEMKNAMGISSKGSQKNFFQLYLMDANLGSRGAYTHNPAEEIFKLIKTDYENGKVKFVAITGNPDVVENAKNNGIPCFSKGNPEEISDYIKK
ncbi:MAG: hypothetical protein WC916_07780 [Candidatus Woesearchaeota archaeon]